jgi:transposase
MRTTGRQAECRQLDGSTPKPAQKWDPWKLLNQVEEWVKAGIKVYSCYEAGACGYWYHRELIKCGAVNYVVAPRPLENQRSKHQKTDRLDARALLDNLESYLRGNRHAITIVAVPSPEQEQQRSVVRHREQLVRNRRRAEARGRALALTQGILAPVGWWRPAAWKQFKTQLPKWMDSQLKHWQEEALATDAKERQVRRELEKMVSIELPIGVGALSWITLELEIRGWDRFQNRRQIASYTGLCPGSENGPTLFENSLITSARNHSEYGKHNMMIIIYPLSAFISVSTAAICALTRALIGKGFGVSIV